MRYAAKPDSNRTEIVEAMRKAGAYVWDIRLPVDLLVGKNEKTWLVEIKRDRKAKYTKLQKDFFRDWKGGPLVRIETVEQAVKLITG